MHWGVIFIGILILLCLIFYKQNKEHFSIKNINYINELPEVYRRNIRYAVRRKEYSKKYLKDNLTFYNKNRNNYTRMYGNLSKDDRNKWWRNWRRMRRTYLNQSRNSKYSNSVRQRARQKLTQLNKNMSIVTTISAYIRNKKYINELHDKNVKNYEDKIVKANKQFEALSKDEKIEDLNNTIKKYKRWIVNEKKMMERNKKNPRLKRFVQYNEKNLQNYRNIISKKKEQITKLQSQKEEEGSISQKRKEEIRQIIKQELSKMGKQI